MMEKYKENIFLRIRKIFSIDEWKVSLLGLSKSKYSSSEPGLVFIQIDGFSKTELNRALELNEMPFLKMLLKKENYKLYAHYPGLPSTTPSVQGELLYGIKQIVPAFFFFDRQTHKVFKMFDADSAIEIERRLAQRGKGLLEGGSSYSNIYTGGAQESHFCAGTLGWDKIWKDVNALNFIMLWFTHLGACIRMTVLSFWEAILAQMDFIYGLLKKEDPKIEFKFIFLRVFLCILLRELITLGAIIDMARGLPIIHLNFIGYDELAHRRGPSSHTAHWSLKGIDACIGRIYRAALKSTRRHYDVWVYSDHGQEKTIPYVVKYKRTVDEAVTEVFNALFQKGGLKVSREPQAEIWGMQFQRIRYFGKWINKIWSLNHESAAPSNSKCVTAAMGPLGHVYVTQHLTAEEKHQFAYELVRAAKIPLVLMLDKEGGVLVCNSKGIFTLPDQGREIINPTHPFYEDVIKDLMAICHHPNAGDFVISGWQKEGEPYSFPFENGAHAGPGEKETDAFALLPSDVIKLPANRGYLKTMDLREAALRLLKRSDGGMGYPRKLNRMVEREKKTIRIMTYNVHSCIGMDGKVSPQRIARVIGQYEPDIVALQELDMNRKRTNHLDQPHLIAKELKMLYHFHPSIQVEEEQYGNAVLSRYPMDLVCSMKLPKLESKFEFESRGAIWVTVNVGGQRLQIINAHLSFYAPECQYQARALVSPEWIGHANCAAPAILCGDFNALPNSRAWRTINQRLMDAQCMLEEHRPLATWRGIGRIDHLFVSSGIKVSAVEVPRTQLVKLASDHLPLIVDLEVINE